jgi:hypothetical protein
MTRSRRVLALLLFALPCVADAARAAELVLGPRVEFVRQVKRQRVRVLPAAIAVGLDGIPVAAWITQEGEGNNVHVARVAGGEARPVRVNPDGMTVDSLYQPPSIAAGPAGEVYLSWSSRRYGGAYGSTLRLSRSLDGGRTFDGHLGVNDDRPISHSFEGLAVARDGTVLVSWIDSRDDPDTAGTYFARIVDRGTRVAGAARLDAATCACCRVSVATGPAETVVAAWRRVLPGDIRDIVLGISRDQGRSFGAAPPVHDDHWRITACPRRGPSVAVDGRGRVYGAWYTEGGDGRPKILLAVAPDGRRFGRPVQVNASAGSTPDHPRLAVAPEGVAVVAWVEATAVRHRVLVRYSTDGGRTLGPERMLSEIVKESASEIVPDIAVTPDGAFVIAWHEERPTSATLILQTLRVQPQEPAPRRP